VVFDYFGVYMRPSCSIGAPEKAGAAHFKRTSGPQNVYTTGLDGSRLRLNPGKTEVVWLGSKCCIDKITVRDISILGVVVDSRLSMADHVSSLWRSVYYQLRQLWLVVRCITEDAAKKLQSVQNAVARLISTPGAALITSSTAHWLQASCSCVQGIDSLK